MDITGGGSGEEGHCWNINTSCLAPENISDSLENVEITFSATADTKIEKENYIMKIEHKNYINGKDVKDFTMEEEITIIQQTEKKIAELEAIGTKTKKMTAEIERLKNSLNEALTLFDKE